MNEDKRERNFGQKDQDDCQDKSKKSHSRILEEHNGEDQDRNGNYFHSWIPRMQR